MIMKTRFVITIECLKEKSQVVRRYVLKEIIPQCQTWKTAGVITRAYGTISEFEVPETWEVN